MRFYENGLTWPFYLFVYTPPHIKFFCRKGEDGQHSPLKTHTAKHSLSSQHQWFPPSPVCSLFSIDHLALSSINLQNALFKMLINTTIDFQKCHDTLRQDLLMVVSPQWCASLQLGKWWMSESMCTLPVCQARPMDFGWRCRMEQSRCWSSGVNVNVMYLHFYLINIL